ncbi:MAG: type II toxin-antitoxin system VapC family toxin [Terriglobales bacterium]|jgi:PIN domain nuclease of toxin-antitoxin system
MNILLDSHTLIWWFDGDSLLSRPAKLVMQNPRNTILVSAATAWELAIKVNLGKLNLLPLIIDFGKQVAEEGFIEQPITFEHATRAGLLPMHHHDPFDRLIVAQAQLLNVPILSADKLFDAYDVRRIW